VRSKRRTHLTSPERHSHLIGRLRSYDPHHGRAGFSLGLYLILGFAFGLPLCCHDHQISVAETDLLNNPPGG